MIYSLIGRNVKLFFRDKAGVFFSLLGPVILFVLYTIFLGGVQTSNLKETFPGSEIANIDNFVNAWVFAGILTIVTITTSLAAIQVFVADKASDRFKDFIVSPIKPRDIIISYLGSTFIISMIMTSIVFLLSEIYITINGGNWLTGYELLGAVSVLALLCAVFSALSSLIVTFIKSIPAFSSLNIIVGTTAGFLAAIYVPIGSLPKTVADVINILPFSQGASLLRQFFATKPLDTLAGGNSEIINNINGIFGMTLKVGENTLSNSYMLISLTLLFFIFIIGAIVQISRKIK